MHFSLSHACYLTGPSQYLLVYSDNTCRGCK